MKSKGCYGVSQAAGRSLVRYGARFYINAVHASASACYPAISIYEDVGGDGDASLSPDQKTTSQIEARQTEIARARLDRFS